MFRRISKAEARRAYAIGLPVVFCPARLRPGFPFAPHSTIYRDDRDFDTRYNEWAFYNTSYEAGRYAHYYIEE